MRALVLCCSAACFLGVSALAVRGQEKTEISDVLHRAQKACEGGRYLEAANLLRQALRQVNRAVVAQLEGLLPEPERGWESDAPKSEFDDFGPQTGLKVRRQYMRSGSAQTVEVEIAIGSPAAGHLMLWLANPIQMERASEGRRLLTIGTRRWVAKYDERDLTAELATVVGMDRVVRVSGFNLRSLEPAEKYAARVPLESLERLFR